MKWFNKTYSNANPLSYIPVSAGWEACKKKVLAILDKHDGADSIYSVYGEIEDL